VVRRVDDCAASAVASRGRWVSENKFGPHRVVRRTRLTNVRITTFFADAHEVRVLDPSRVELLAAIML
jgi:hypothetical protein